MRVTREQGIAVLHLEGELDLASAPALKAEMDSPEVATCAKLVLDLRELQFIDSTGLRTIFAALASARGRGQDFAVTQGTAQVQRLLAITGVGEHLRVVGSPQEMLA
jgi:anti-sigma B factor antagonist